MQRTGLLLHLVDLAPFDEATDPVAEAKAIVNELNKYDAALYDKPRWLVLNKLDMLDDATRAKRVAEFVKRFKWTGPVFEISALTGQGCEGLIYAIYDHLAKHGRLARRHRPRNSRRSALPRGRGGHAAGAGGAHGRGAVAGWSRSTQSS